MQNDIEPLETQVVGKVKLGPKDALRLAKDATTVLVARGKKVISFDMKRDAPEDAELLGLMLGRSGTLRAPTLRRGKTLLVGFNSDLYGDNLS